MAKLVLPYPFRQHAEGLSSIEIEGENLRAVVDGMVKAYPGLAAPLEKSGRFMAVFVNGERVAAAAQDWGRVAVSPADEVAIVLPIAGG